MKEQVICEIASLRIAISGLSVELFKRTMHPYKDFYSKSDSDNEIISEIQIIENLIIDDEFYLVQSDIDDAVIFKQYKHPDGRMMIKAIFNGIERHMIANHNFSLVLTDAIIGSRYSAFLLDRFILITFLARGIDYNVIKIHASSICYKNKALAFLGVSGTGKSTHSKLWTKYISGSEILNDDEPFIKIQDNILHIYGAPWSGSTDYYKQTHYPLKAIIHLRQAPYNKIQKLSAIKSTECLMLSINTLKMYSGMLQKQEKIVMDILERVSVYRLDCLPNEDAVKLTANLLE